MVSKTGLLPNLMMATKENQLSIAIQTNMDSFVTAAIYYSKNSKPMHLTSHATAKEHVIICAKIVRR